MAASANSTGFWRIDDPHAFVGSLDPSEEAAYRKAWRRCFFADSIDVTSEVLEAAFVALDHWGMTPEYPPPPELRMALISVVQVILRRVQEQPEEAPALIPRWASYHFCPNFVVASESLLRLGFLRRHRELIIPIASRIARSKAPWTEPTPNSLRGVAAIVLFKLAPDIATQPEFREARHDLGRAILQYWDQPKLQNERMGRLDDLLRARRLLSS